ncbi:MAG: hypothetical protein IPH35_09010 [Rhodoferax sp.]|nr:hypothetical protein [Rhodoferax sp.]
MNFFLIAQLFGALTDAARVPVAFAQRMWKSTRTVVIRKPKLFRSYRHSIVSTYVQLRGFSGEIAKKLIAKRC